jgi:hypothetical protein
MDLVLLVNGSLPACGFAFDWDDDGFACSNTMGISNLSLSLSHEYHHHHRHPDSQTGKKEANCHVDVLVEGLTTLQSE